jgi:hypothetical protein
MVRILLALVCTLLTPAAWGQLSQPQASLPCDAFVRSANGYWSPTRQVTINARSGNGSIGPGMTFCTAPCSWALICLKCSTSNARASRGDRGAPASDAPASSGQVPVVPRSGAKSLHLRRRENAADRRSAFGERCTAYPNQCMNPIKTQTKKVKVPRITPT